MIVALLHCSFFPAHVRHCVVRLHSGVLQSRLIQHSPLVLQLHCANDAMAHVQVARHSRSLSDFLPTKLAEEMRHAAVNPNDGAVQTYGGTEIPRHGP